MMMPKTTILLVTLVAAAGLAASAQTPARTPAPSRGVALGDWPEARGPERDGVSKETGLVEKWALNGQNFLWRAPYGGRSAPIVMGNRVYVQNPSGRGADLQERVMALDADTGKVVREYKFNIFQSDVPPHRVGWASPAADPETGNIYALGVGATVLALGKDGKKIWERSVGEEFAAFTTHGGRTMSPLVDDDLVIVSAAISSWGAQANRAHRFIALDKRTGDIVWVAAPGGRPDDTAYAAPVIATINGTRLLVCGTGEGAPAHVQVSPTELVLKPGQTVKLRVKLFDAKGRFLREEPAATWSVQGLKGTLANGSFTVASDPAEQAGTIKATVGAFTGDWPMWGGTPDRNMVSNMKGLPTEWDIKTKKNVKWVSELDTNPKDSVWPKNRNEVISTPVIFEDKVYIANGQDPEHGEGVGHLYCIDASTRGDITTTGAVWHYDKIRRSISTASIADGLLCIPDFSGFLHCLDAKTGQVYWTHDVFAAVWGSTLVVDGKVYLGDEDADIVILATGKQKKVLAELNMGSAVYVTPVPAHGALFLNNRNQLFALAAK